MEDKQNTGRFSRFPAKAFGALAMAVRMFRIYGKLDILWFFRDTRICALQIIMDAVSAMASLAGVYFLSRRFGGLGGMDSAQLLFMLGFSLLSEGVYLLLTVNANTGQMSRIIARGQLDHHLIAPVPLWMQFLTEGFAPVSGSSTLFCGIAVTSYATWKMGLAVSPIWIIKLGAAALCSALTVFSVVLLVSCLAFLSPASTEEVAPVVYGLFSSLRSYPLGALPLVWRTFFCTVVPVGLAAWLPSAALLGLHTAFPALPAAAALLFFVSAVKAFMKGMKFYGKSGSPRYSGFGFR